MRVISIRAFALYLVSGLAGHGALAQSDRPWVDPPMRRPAEPAPSGSQPAQATAPADAARPSLPPSPRAPEPSPQRAGTPPGAGAPGAAPAPSAQAREAPPPNSSTSPHTVSPANPPGPPGAAPPNEPAPAVPARKEAATAAETLAGAYLDYWSAPNAVTLDATPDFYAPRVEFHGREMSARALYEEKRRFVRRWPVRHYVARPESTEATCSGETCTVRTTFDYRASNPESGRRSQGVANLELEISFAGGAPVIVAETSRVLRS